MDLVGVPGQEQRRRAGRNVDLRVRSGEAAGVESARDERANTERQGEPQQAESHREQDDQLDQAGSHPLVASLGASRHPLAALFV